MKISPQEISLINYMGTDLSVVNAARVSFDKESSWCSVKDVYGDLEYILSDKDVKLIRYLATNNHFTPFTHCSATFRIKCPIFVARQLHKHQVGFTVNEVSRRYVDTAPEFYFPDTWRKKAENVKQGSSTEVCSYMYEDQWNGREWGDDRESPDSMIKGECASLVMWYEDVIRNGMCAEQARMFLPQNMHTEFIMTGSLYGWARLCKLRLDSHAQKEIRDIAEMLSLEMKQLFPISWEALLEHN